MPNPIQNIMSLREIAFTGGSPVYMVQCTTRSIDSKISTVVNRAGGQPEISFVAGMDIEPMVSWSTTEITRMLTVMDYQVGCAISSTATYTGLDFYFTNAQDLGTYQSGSTLMKVATTRGLVIPGETSVRQGGEASISATYYSTTTDGTTAPWTISTGQAASAATMTVNQKYTLGKCTLNGTHINGVQGWSASYGADYELIRADGGPYPCFCRIKFNNPIFKIQTNDPTYLSSIGMEGVAISSSSDFYLQALTNKGTRVAAATTSHIRHRVSTGYLTVGAVSGGNGEAASTELTITPTKESGTFLTVSTGVAIP